ncbi:MAG TPA: DUF2304 domain-containing protein [Xanthobacteraceae bacterium]|nr:DUF2304 domain-containing protein [Xanthobacteraceae bacterium]
MIAQCTLSFVLLGVIGYAWTEYRRSPVVALLSACTAAGGFYFVWFPAQSNQLAEFAGVGRGSDLIVYTWAALSLLVMLNLHLKLRFQLELITVLARRLALANCATNGRAPAPEASPLRDRVTGSD